MATAEDLARKLTESTWITGLLMGVVGGAIIGASIGYSMELGKS